MAQEKETSAEQQAAMERLKKAVPECEERKKKKFPLFTLLLVVGLLGFLVWAVIPWHWLGYIERSRHSAAEALLFQLSVAEVAFSVDNNAFVFGSNAADINKLAAYGFRPDPNVGFVILPLFSPPVSDISGFIIFAAHRASGSILYVYDNVNGNGVAPATAATYGGGVARPDSLPLFTMNSDGEIEASGAPPIELKNGKVR
ncbi:MAG: hypothetical protein LBV79_00590 [Candidatus Adiutrix sp.]|jgi:hypothetical protein|nr:hypothetical protein [Candidatus Adiutrix sp.]